MDFKDAQVEFMKLFRGLKNKNTQSKFMKWVRDEPFHDDGRLTMAQVKTSDVMMQTLAEEISSLIPLSATVPTENITPPKDENSSATACSVKELHLDEFLYNGEAVDELVETNALSLHYCKQCNSDEHIEKYELTSHSASLDKIRYIFTCLLPDLTGKTVLDVGSRLGAILYGAKFYGEAAQIVGVEMNESLCDIQRSIVKSHGLEESISIICNDILNEDSLLRSADVVILHNVFEYFNAPDIQKRIWRHLYNTVRKPGCLIVTVPSIEDSLDKIEACIPLDDWIKPESCVPALIRAILLFPSYDENLKLDLSEIHLYRVVSK